MSRPAAAIAAVIAALIGFVLRPILLATDKLPGIDAHNLYAWEVYTRRVFQAGRLPFWNPYFFTGIPHLADAQTQVLYPVALALRWVPLPLFLSVMAAVHIWIAAVGTLALARVAGTGWTAAAAAALAVAFGGSVPPWIHNGHLLLLESAAWLPWVLTFAFLSTARRSCLPRTGLVVVCGLQFLTGNLQGTLYTAAALGAFYGLVFIRSGTAPRRQLLAQVSLTGLLTASLVAFQLIPTTMLVNEAGRTSPLPWETAADGGWRAADLARILSPFADVPRGGSYRDLSDSAVYVGILLVLMIPFAFASRERRRTAVFFALVGGASIAVASAAWLPFYKLHYALFPGLRIPGRVLFIATLSLAMLGALGLDEILRRIGRHSMTAARVVGAAAVLCVGFDVVAFAAPAVEPVSVSVASPLVATAAGHAGGRVLSICDNRVAAEEMMVAQRPSLDGVPGMHLAAYADWAALARFGTPPPHDGMYRRISTDGDFPARPDLIDAANVGTVLACKPVHRDGLQLVASDGVVDVYRNVSAWPRAIWTCVAEWSSPHQVEVRLLQTTLADALDSDRQWTMTRISGDDAELLVGTRSCADRALVSVLAQDRADGRLTIRYDAPVDGIVFVSEAFYPQRHAYVDGRRVPTIRSNVAFTAIPVPAGQHRLDLLYVPVGFYVGSGLSVVTVCGWAAWTCWKRDPL